MDSLELDRFFHRDIASRVIYGADALASLRAELDALGVTRPVLVCGRRTAASRLFRSVLGAVEGLAYATFTEMPQHTPIAAVRRLRDIAHEQRADGFIAVGGGSASDACKVAAIWLAEGGDIEACASRFSPPSTLVIPDLPAPKLPIVTIPSTASAAEVTPSAGLCLEDGRKIVMSDHKVASRLIFIDPQATIDTPAPVVLASGMNGLAHCIEGLYSSVRTPITTALALHGIGLFAQALPAVAKEPASVEARGALLVAAHLSGRVLLNARTCLHHAVCHALGAVAGLSHGDANSIMLPHAMRFNATTPLGAAAIELASSALGSTKRSVEGALERVLELQLTIGVPRRLRDVGTDAALLRSRLREVAAKTMQERGLYFNPRFVDGADAIEQLLEEAW